MPQSPGMTIRAMYLCSSHSPIAITSAVMKAVPIGMVALVKRL